MNEDMSDLMKQFTTIMENNEMPENIKNIFNSLKVSSNSGNSSKTNNSNSDEKIKNTNENKSNTESVNNSTDNNFDFSSIDINTILKLKSLLDTMNNSKDDPRANLLKSLKPYLKESRKDKVDQYIKLFGITKVFESLNPLGGENKNDI